MTALNKQIKHNPLIVLFLNMGFHSVDAMINETHGANSDFNCMNAP